ncbi:unnamed protein product [Boreogadus saida]
MELQVCLLEGNQEHVPKDEIVLLQAGLGRRTVNISENADHEDISRALQEEYPKMRGLCGGWLLKKGAGGSGKRKITSLPQGTQGYTGKILKTSSNSGKYVLYIVPLQESLDLKPLAHTAVEFHKMPKHPCMACRSEIPLPLLPHHIKLCNKDEPDLIDDDDEDDAEDTAAAKDVNDDVIAMQSCPICGQDFAVDYLSTHAAWCDERPMPSCSTQPQLQDRPEGVQDRPEGVQDRAEGVQDRAEGVQDRAEGVDDGAWRNIADVGMAADQFRQALLVSKEDERNLKVKLDMAEDEEDREGQIINFYKTPNIDWARPFQAKLQGDVAIGDGGARHFLSLVIHKLKHGFAIDVGNSCGAMLFEGQSDHLIPSSSKILMQNDMFIMAGRMIGHAFLHSGPRLTGLSPAVLHVLAGGTPQTATIALEDINDIDVRETIGPLYEVCESNNGNLTTLSVEQRDSIKKLAVEMDYSILKETNRCWLLHNLLQDAVFGRIKEQLKQIKQGLKETYVLDLLEARPDAITLSPSEAEATCSPEVVLDFIQWPQEDDGQEPKKI